MEEQFYLLFPCLVLVLWGPRVAKGGFCGMKQDRWPAVAQLLCLIASMLASFIFCFWMSAKQPTQAYYLLPSRFWQLMSGAVLLVVHDHGWLLDLGLLGSLLMELVAIICIGLAVVYTPGDHGFPLPWSLLGIVGALATIAAGRLPRRQVAGAIHTPILRTALSTKQVVYLGKISYPLYLIHWPVLTIFRWTVTLSTWPARISAGTFMVIGARVLYHVVEAPFRNWRPTEKETCVCALRPAHERNGSLATAMPWASQGPAPVAREQQAR